MKQTKKKHSSSPYGLLKNIVYIYRILFREFPIMWLFVFGSILLSVILPLIENLIPTLAVSCITQQRGISFFLISMSVLILAYGLFTLIKNCMDSWSDFYIDHMQNETFLLNLVMKSLNTDYVNVESPKQQRLLNEASHAVNMYREGVNLMYSTVPRLFTNAIGMVLYATTITILDYRILLIIIIMCISSFLLEKRARNIEFSLKDDQFRIYGRLYYLKHRATTLEGSKDIRIYHMLELFTEGIMRLVRKDGKLAKTRSNAYLLTIVTEICLTLLRDYVAYAILVYEVIRGRINLAGFTFCLGIITGISSWIRYLRINWTDICNGNLMLIDYRKMMDYPDRFQRKDGISLPSKDEMPPSIEFRNVSFAYEESETMILKNLSFTIRPRERIALVGHNGAGKTTLVKLLCGFYQPTEGSILVGGHSIDEYNIDEYYGLLSTIFQEANTLPLSIASTFQEGI